MTRQPTRWTPSLAIRTTIYLTVVTPLLALSSDVRDGLGYLLGQLAVGVGLGVGVLLGLLMMLGFGAPRR